MITKPRQVAYLFNSKLRGNLMSRIFPKKINGKYHIELPADLTQDLNLDQFKCYFTFCVFEETLILQKHYHSPSIDTLFENASELDDDGALEVDFSKFKSTD